MAAVAELAAVVMMMVRRILEKGGAVMQEGGVPFSPFRSHDSYRCAYNCALQNDL